MKTKLLILAGAFGMFANTVGAQIVLQSDFETWTSGTVAGWNGSKTNCTTTPDSVNQCTVTPYHGLSCVELVNPGASSKRFSSQPVAITAGTLYSVRFWARGSGSLRTGLAGVTAANGFGYEYSNTYITLASPTWTLYTQTLLADSTNANAQFLFAVKNTLAASGNVDIDSVTIRVAGTAPFQSLYNIQYTTAVPANSPYNNQVVTTAGIVTAVFGYGYFVETTGATSWAALYVYDSQHTVAMGDSIIFSGLVDEYYNETEMENIVYLNDVSHGNPIPTPIVVTYSNIQNEEWEGMLIKVNNTSCVRYNAAQAWYVFKDASPGIDTVDNIIYTYPFSIGKTYNITGVIHFEYANWIEPRFVADIDSIHVTAGIQEFNNFSNFKVFPNPNNGTFTVSINTVEEGKNSILALKDLTGRVIYQEQRDVTEGFSSWVVNTTGLPKGLYLLEVSNATGKAVERISVQ